MSNSDVGMPTHSAKTSPRSEGPQVWNPPVGLLTSQVHFSYCQHLPFPGLLKITPSSSPSSVSCLLWFSGERVVSI